MKNYEINHTKGKIIITKAFGKRANDYNSDEYQVLAGLLKDFPTYKVKYKEIKRNSNKNTYAGLTYDRMAEYIQITNPDMLTQFETVKKVAATQNARYAFVKKWFLDTFKEYGKAEEMLEAVCA